MKFKCECNYCKTNTYNWLINNGIVWVEIPKNGSYNFKTFKFNYNSEKVGEVQPNSLITSINEIDITNHKRAFVIIRNPIERFKSLLSHYFIHGSRFSNNVGPYWLRSIGIHTANDSNICDIVLNNWDKLGSISEPHHFNSQASFIPNSFFEIPHMVYNMNELSIMFGLQSNVNTSGISDVILSSSNLDRIRTIYSDDFELYKKYFESL